MSKQHKGALAVGVFWSWLIALYIWTPEVGAITLGTIMAAILGLASLMIYTEFTGVA